MNSLQDLNSYSSTSLQVSDNRKATVKFDRVYPLTPLNQLLNITSTTVSIGAGINIVEIVNYSIANVRYRITVQNFGTPAFTGSTISWASLPAGVSLSQVGDVYTLSGISTVAQWNAIKSFTWTLPSNYATRPTWNLKSEIIYYDQTLGQDVTVSWLDYDPAYYFKAQVYATSSLTAKGKYYRANGHANISSTANLTGRGRRVACGISLSTSSGTVTCTLSAVIKGLSSKLYYKNTRNPFWMSNNGTTGIDNPTVQLEGLPSFTYVGVILTVSSGTLAFENSWVGPGSYDYAASSTRSSTWSYNNSNTSLSNLNSALEYVTYYPVPGQTSNVTLTFQIMINNTTTYLTRTMTLTYSGIRTGTWNPSYTGETLTYTASGSWTPTDQQLLWSSSFDYLLVGGGGGGQNGGGGAGKYIESFGNTLTAGSKSITIGSGGASGFSYLRLYGRPSTNSYTEPDSYAGPGYPSSFNGQTAQGGEGAGNPDLVTAGITPNRAYSGGSLYQSDGYTTGPYYGGTGSAITVNATTTEYVSGSGAGALGNGTNGFVPATDADRYNVPQGGAGYSSSLYTISTICRGGDGSRYHRVTGTYSYQSQWYYGNAPVGYGSGGAGANTTGGTEGNRGLGIQGVLIIKINA